MNAATQECSEMWRINFASEEWNLKLLPRKTIPRGAYGEERMWDPVERELETPLNHVTVCFAINF